MESHASVRPASEGLRLSKTKQWATARWWRHGETFSVSPLPSPYPACLRRYAVATIAWGWSNSRGHAYFKAATEGNQALASLRIRIADSSNRRRVASINPLS